MWNDMMNDVLTNAPESKEAEVIRYYFIDKKQPVKNKVALILSIITGVKANSKCRDYPI